MLLTYCIIINIQYTHILQILLTFISHFSSSVFVPPAHYLELFHVRLVHKVHHWELMWQYFLSPNSTMPTSHDKPMTSPLAQIPLCRLPRNFPVQGSFGEVDVTEFGLKGTSRVCRGRYREVGIVEFGLYRLHSRQPSCHQQTVCCHGVMRRVI